VEKRLLGCRKERFTFLALFLQGEEMIGSFASEAPGPAIIPPEQVEILAHKVSCKNWFVVLFRPLQGV
jgi:hypothetical protein